MSTTQEDTVTVRAPDAPPPSYGPTRRPPLTLASLARYWWLVLILGGALAAVGVVAADRRAPTYSAASELNVGRLDIQAQAIPGYVEGAKSLAVTYSRIASTPVIVDAVASDLKVTSSSLEGRISASPLPQSQLFRVVGTGASADEAIQVSRAATDQVRRYVRALSRGPNSVAAILREYRTASAEADRLQRRRDTLRARRAADEASVGRSTVDKAAVDAASAQLRATALGTRYQQQVQNAGGAAQVQVLRTADVATSDKSSTRQKFGALGFAVGALLGIMLGVLLARRRRRV